MSESILNASRVELDRAAVVRWRNGVFLVFLATGLTFSSWAARLPRVRDELGATTGQMGLVVLAMAIGSIVGLVASSHVLARFGSQRTMAFFFALLGAGMVAAGMGVELVSYPLLAAGMVLAGLGMGTTDVAMNLNGAVAERALGRTVMPLFHAFFSFGTMGGAGIGALAELLGVGVGPQMAVLAVVLVAAVLVGVRWTQHENSLDTRAEADEPASTARDRLAVWRQPATILIGLIVLGMALAEGSANDWVALAMVDGHQTSNAVGGAGLVVFVTAMTVGRVAGVWVLDRFGRVPVLRATALVASVGLATTIFSPWTSLAFVGIALWGLGSSLGFPVGMSAAADDPRQAAARVSAVATIGYVAFLVGPPVIGFLGEQVGILHALLVVLVLVALVAFVAPAAREQSLER
ncbi:MFS transporter [Auraticoccus monumenti]|uniref:Cyanate permease n=1 Tax=Auraticoccus monumenti TaxID=675864 RepID=A0A1G6VE96_9ACTN|nr:MFS transporter [Auraticoccus monumenti]SDD51347.1 Cyanate permease [Auraticoccus monumenti]